MAWTALLWVSSRWRQVRQLHAVGIGIDEQLVGVHNDTPAVPSVLPEEVIKPCLLSAEVAVGRIETDIRLSQKEVRRAIGGTVVHDHEMGCTERTVVVKKPGQAQRLISYDGKNDRSARQVRQAPGPEQVGGSFSPGVPALPERGHAIKSRHESPSGKVPRVPR
jgi:hypothetical protein